MKDELRIGKYVLFKCKYILQYYHVRCTFDSFRQMCQISDKHRNGYIKEIEGAENITSDEKISIVKLISEVNTNRSKPPSQHPQ